MNSDTAIAHDTPQPLFEVAQPEDHRWFTCRGCQGAVGVPLDWRDNTVECPECNASVQVNCKVLYRPPAAAPSTTAVGPAIQKSASHELSSKSQSALVLGIASIVLGWTFVVPLIGMCYYWEAASHAEKEKIPVPGKATVGIALSLVFGVIQGLSVLAHAGAFK
jgi:hypothetical protein